MKKGTTPGSPVRLTLMRLMLAGIVGGLGAQGGLATRSSASSSEEVTTNQSAPVSRPQLVLQTPHRRRVLGTVFAPDGKTVVSYSLDGDFKVWDARSGELLHVWHAPPERLTHAFFTPDGQQLLVGYGSLDDAGGADFEVRDGRTYRLLRQAHSSQTLLAMALAPDGRSLALAFGQAASAPQGISTRFVLWDAATLRPLRELTSVEGTVTELHYLPPGEGAAERGDRFVSVALNFKPRALSPRSSAVATEAPKASAPPGEEWTIRVQDATKGTTQGDIALGTAVRSVAVSPDGSILAVGLETRQICLYDLRRRTLIRTLTVEEADLRAAAASPAGVTLGTVRASGNVVTGQTRELRVDMLRGKDGTVDALSFSPDGKTLVGAQNITVPFVKAWDVKTGQALYRMLSSRRDEWITTLQFAPDGRTLVGGGGVPYEEDGYSSRVSVWDAQTGQQRWTQGGVSYRFFPAQVSPNGRWLAAGQDGGNIAQVWDLRSGRLRHTLGGTNTRCLAFASGSNLVATGGSTEQWDFTQRGCVTLWDCATGKRLQQFLAQDTEIRSLAFAPDGQNLAGAAEGIRIWDLKTRRLQRTLPFEADSLTYSPQGTYLATLGHVQPLKPYIISNERARSHSLVLWSRNGQKLWQIPRAAGIQTAFSPDGRFLAHADTRLRVCLRAPASGKLLRVLAAPASDLLSVAFSGDGRLVLGVTRRGLVRWNVATGALQSQSQLEDSFYTLDPAWNGQRLVSTKTNVWQYWNSATGRLLASGEVLNQRRASSGLLTSWITSTPAGFYTGFPDVSQFVRWQKTESLAEPLAPAPEFAAAFQRPDLVAHALSAP